MSAFGGGRKNNSRGDLAKTAFVLLSSSLLAAACGARSGLEAAAASASAASGASSLAGGGRETSPGGAFASSTGNGDGASTSSAGGGAATSSSATGGGGSGAGGGSTKQKVVSIAAGVHHSCAVTDQGAVYCWGDNSFAQLGNPGTALTNVPILMPELTSGISAVAGGSGHTCALTTEGGVVCWGLNDGGQLGDGLSSHGTTCDAYDCSYTPVAVVGLSSGVISISAGFEHTCALTASGAVLCWGYNGEGELGDGTLMNRPTPVAVSGFAAGAVAVSAGFLHTCAVTSTGAAFCWGRGDDGQLGDGMFTHEGCGFNDCSPTPVQVLGLSSSATAITAGTSHTCALTDEGAVLCWGDGTFGELGDGSTAITSAPVSVSKLPPIAAISAGGDVSCALLAAGGGNCWGDATFGELGNGSDTSADVPVDILDSLGPMTGISVGGDHVCARTTEGQAMCWGLNDYGQLGSGSGQHAMCLGGDCSLSPVEVVGF